MMRKRIFSFLANVGVMVYRSIFNWLLAWCLNQKAHSVIVIRNRKMAGLRLPYQPSHIEVPNKINRRVIMVQILSPLGRKMGELKY